ncbi:MAG: ral secretion pathway protein GspG, partial [Geminicoccaceae bacterium]|nr:ral secretion pathway protein GspG [Geminicoccaceae bacterium]MCE3247886.1 ral secretion pathway protein GspG [Geminicoccaceae bacterium]
AVEGRLGRAAGALRHEDVVQDRGDLLSVAELDATIISLILGLVGPRVLNYLGESRTKTAKLQIENLGSALDLFYLDAGRYPTTAEGLNALVQKPTGIQAWNGPYLKGSKLPVDPWGNPYQYRSPVERAPYEIVSHGADGREGGTGTAADLSNLER